MAWPTYLHISPCSPSPPPTRSRPPIFFATTHPALHVPPSGAIGHDRRVALSEFVKRSRHGLMQAWVALQWGRAVGVVLDRAGEGGACVPVCACVYLCACVCVCACVCLRVCLCVHLLCEYLCVNRRMCVLC